MAQDLNRRDGGRHPYVWQRALVPIVSRPRGAQRQAFTRLHAHSFQTISLGML